MLFISVTVIYCTYNFWIALNGRLKLIADTVELFRCSQCVGIASIGSDNLRSSAMTQIEIWLTNYLWQYINPLVLLWNGVIACAQKLLRLFVQNKSGTLCRRWVLKWNLVFLFLQVSWIRHRDIHILTVGTYTYTSDQRFQTTHRADTDDWVLHIKWAQQRDAGMYECQVSTQPVRSYFVNLNIVGQ
jgi:hypothetical protein